MGLESPNGYFELDAQDGFFIHMPGTWHGVAGVAEDWLGISFSIQPPHIVSLGFLTTWQF